MTDHASPVTPVTLTPTQPTATAVALRHERDVLARVEREERRRAARYRQCAATMRALDATAQGRAVRRESEYDLDCVLGTLAWVLPVNPRADRALAVVLRELVANPNG